MEIIIGTRGSGKSVRLMKYAHKYDLQVVCIDRRACCNFSDLANQLNIKIKYPITFQELINGECYRRKTDKFVLDDVDQMLQHLVETSIQAVTFNIDDIDQLDNTEDSDE